MTQSHLIVHGHFLGNGQSSPACQLENLGSNKGARDDCEFVLARLARGKEGRNPGESLPVLGCRCAGVDVARSGGVPGVHEGGNGSGGAGGSVGGEAVGGDGGPGAGAGAGRGGGAAVSGADAGASACGGAASGLAGSPSSPSCVRWCSCSHSTWLRGGGSARPSASETIKRGGKPRSLTYTVEILKKNNSYI